MRTFISHGIASLLLFSSGVAAAQTCAFDTSGTLPTVQNYGLPANHICFGCRELNKFTQDFANETWNYTHGGGATMTYGRYFGNLDGYGRQSQMLIRNCNGIGQCANTLLITNFNTFATKISYLPVEVRTSIASWQLVTPRADGTQHTVTKYPALPQGALPVPATSTDDGYTPGVDCLNNNGTRRGGSGGGGTPSGPGSDPTAPGYDDRDRCGRTYLDDGDYRRTCL